MSDKAIICYICIWSHVYSLVGALGDGGNSGGKDDVTVVRVMVLVMMVEVRVVKTVVRIIAAVMRMLRW